MLLFLLKRICLLPFIIAINRKVGLKKAPSCLNFTASIIKNLLHNDKAERFYCYPQIKTARAFCRGCFNLLLVW